jgi:hypothetical protein
MNVSLSLATSLLVVFPQRIIESPPAIKRISLGQGREEEEEEEGSVIKD